MAFGAKCAPIAWVQHAGFVAAGCPERLRRRELLAGAAFGAPPRALSKNMHLTVWALVALAFIVHAALTWRLRVRCMVLAMRLRRIERRESEALETVKALGAASRQSSAAVLGALDAALREHSPSIDTVIIFRQVGAEFVPLLATGPRAAAFERMRYPVLGVDTPLTQVLARGHRVSLEPQLRPLIPTDRGALAVRLGSDQEAVVVYVSTPHSSTIENADEVVKLIEHSAAPFEQACEREAYRESATYDGLTGLLTPGAFRTRLSEDLRIAKICNGPSFSLWFVDADNFKQVNDTHGHAAGDLVLQGIARQVSSHVTQGIDAVARYGGDEFCALVRNVDKSAGVVRAQALCDAVAAARFGPAPPPAQGVGPVSVSVGVAGFPADAQDAPGFIDIADAAMYHSKRCGRNRVSFLHSGGFTVFEAT